MRSINIYSMNYNSFKIIPVLILIFLTSCEDVIDIELQNTTPQLVIESLITENISPVEVKITKSVDFYEPSEYDNISKAIVNISDSRGNSEQLTETVDGIYQSSQISGIPGVTYYLSVETGGITYTATSSMPEKVNLDSLEYELSETPRHIGYLVKLYFSDPAGIDNYYRIRIFENGEPFVDGERAMNEIILWDDKIFDGKNVHIPCKTGGKLFDVNDTITIQLESIGKETYQYYNTLKNAIAQGTSIVGKSMMEGAAAPANPETNLNNGALGYFGAITVSEKTIIINDNN